MLWAVPLSTTELIPRSLTATLNVPAFEVWLTSVTRSGPSAIQSPTSGTHTVTLHLNAFRGEPAITEFDWPFTPNHIRSLADVSNLVGPISHPEPYLRHTHATLHLNAFRGEPAITEFDWPFTPNHRSSPRFSTLVGSGLHTVLPALHPAHG